MAASPSSRFLVGGTFHTHAPPFRSASWVCLLICSLEGVTLSKVRKFLEFCVIGKSRSLFSGFPFPCPQEAVSGVHSKVYSKMQKHVRVFERKELYRSPAVITSSVRHRFPPIVRKYDLSVNQVDESPCLQGAHIIAVESRWGW